MATVLEVRSCLYRSNDGGEGMDRGLGQYCWSVGYPLAGEDGGSRMREKELEEERIGGDGSGC